MQTKFKASKHFNTFIKILIKIKYISLVIHTCNSRNAMYIPIKIFKVFYRILDQISCYNS